ncbi:MAG: endonuclease/exonuclease/phosphatase family protein [Bdellovibrionota bacterium]
MKLLLLFILFSFSAVAKDMTVFSMNLHCGLDDWQKRMDVIIDEVIRLNPDVIGLQEVCYNAEMNMAKYIGDTLSRKGYPVKSQHTIDTHRSFVKYQEQLLIISRHAAQDLESGNLPGPGFLQNGYISFRLGNLRFLTTHLHFALSSIRRSQYEFIQKKYGKQAVIIFGDLNSNPEDSETNVLKKALWTPFFDGPTFPSDNPKKTFDGYWMTEKFHEEVMATTIDRIFLNRGTQPSDHLGINLSILLR